VSFAFLGAALVLAVHFLVATMLSLLVAAALPAFEKLLEGLDPRCRATRLLALALLPAAGGLFAALALIAPAWLLYEPRGLAERPGPLLILLAASGAALVALRLGIALRDQWRTARLVGRWTRESRELHGLPLTATRIAHDLPLAALFGLLRPRLLLSEALLEALSGEELEAVLAHECAHVAARENLKRFLLRASPDPLALLPGGARLRAAFEAAAEIAADRSACARVPPLRLARALLKVAALMPSGRRPHLAVAALHREGGIAARVQMLLRAHDGHAEGAGAERRASPAARRVLALLVAAAVMALASDSLPLVHRLLEGFVHLLS
jgi:Zn-dependent protease with chaperone function